MLVLLAAMVAMVTNCAAQDTTKCNPAFYINYMPTGFYFIPVPAVDSAHTKYTWNFGDGSGFDSEFAPFHKYAEYGTYLVTHTIKRATINGTLVCEDSVTMTVNYTCSTTSSFIYRRDSLQPNKLYFTNTSVSV